MIVDLDIYGSALRVIIQFRSYDKTLPFETQNLTLQQEYDACRKTRDSQYLELVQLKTDFGNLNTKYNLLLGEKDNLDKQLTQSLQNLAELRDATEKTIFAQNQQLQQQIAKIQELEAQILTLSTSLNQTDNEKQKQINNLMAERDGLQQRLVESQLELSKRLKLKKIWKLGKTGLLLGLLDDKSPVNTD
jgi:seryl-tRNA synthetase